MYEGSTAVVKHKDKDQAAGLEIAESFIFFGQQAYKAHIKSVNFIIHNDDMVEVARGRLQTRGVI